MICSGIQKQPPLDMVTLMDTMQQQTVVENWLPPAIGDTTTTMLDEDWEHTDEMEQGVEDQPPTTVRTTHVAKKRRVELEEQDTEMFNEMCREGEIPATRML